MSLKRVLITGASRGIGAAIARELAREGHLVLLAARNEDALMQLSAECLALGARAAVPVPADLMTDVGRQRAALALAEQEESLEPCLIQNAGIAALGPFAEQSRETVAQVLHLDFVAAVDLAHLCLPVLRQGRGQIVHLLSVAGESALAGSAVYGAAKAGLRHFGRVLREELRADGVRVGQILPGAVDTAVWDAVENAPPRNSMMSAESVAQAVAWMLSRPRDHGIEEMVMMPPMGVLDANPPGESR